MDVGMAALAAAFLSSISLGLLLCIFFWVIRFLAKAIVGTCSGKVMHECWLFLKMVWVSVCVIVFLYAANRGVFRWFLLAGAAGTCLLTEHLFGHFVSRVTDRVVGRARRAVIRGVFRLTAPVRVLVRLVGRLICGLARKIDLRVRAFCDKMTIQHYDKMKRSQRRERAVRMEISGLLGGTT